MIAKSKIKVTLRLLLRVYGEHIRFAQCQTVTSPLATLGRRINVDRRILAGCLLFLIFFASPVYAANPDAAGLTQIEDVFRQVISVVVGLGFIAMLVMIVMAGIKYLTSAGEPKAVQAAHQALTWALGGVFFMIIAWLALLLIKALTGIDVTVFDVKVLL